MTERNNYNEGNASSPTFALIMACSISGEGLVTVSDLKSIIIPKICLQYKQFAPQIIQLTKGICL